MNAPVLQVTGLVAGYRAGIDILHGIDLAVSRREIVTVVGANGAGKSTLLKAIMGWVPQRTGSILYGDEDLIRRRPYAVAALGLGYVPQLDNVFPSLSIEENISLGAGKVSAGTLRQRREHVLDMFPDLAHGTRRQAGLLSGGQRQMLAMARALMAEPSMVLLDEPTAGLAPELVERLFEQVGLIRDSGVTVLMVEQNARRALEISDRGYVFDLGRNHSTGPGPELLADPEIVNAYLGRATGEPPPE